MERSFQTYQRKVQREIREKRLDHGYGCEVCCWFSLSYSDSNKKENEKREKDRSTLLSTINKTFYVYKKKKNIKKFSLRPREATNAVFWSMETQVGALPPPSPLPPSLPMIIISDSEPAYHPVSPSNPEISVVEEDEDKPSPSVKLSTSVGRIHDKPYGTLRESPQPIESPDEQKNPEKKDVARGGKRKLNAPTVGPILIKHGDQSYTTSTNFVNPSTSSPPFDQSKHSSPDKKKPPKPPPTKQTPAVIASVSPGAVLVNDSDPFTSTSPSPSNAVGMLASPSKPDLEEVSSSSAQPPTNLLSEDSWSDTTGIDETITEGSVLLLLSLLF